MVEFSTHLTVAGRLPESHTCDRLAIGASAKGPLSSGRLGDPSLVGVAARPAC